VCVNILCLIYRDVIRTSSNRTASAVFYICV